MAMTGVEIFKLLPKTNCKKCGFPTCLAFAMKLAQRQADISACPDVSEEAKATLGEASAPPIRGMKLGTGEKAVKMGEENVMFRHEKRFVNPCALALNVADSVSDDELGARAAEVAASEIDRVGQKLRVDALSIEFTSGDAARYAAAVKLAADKAPETALILNCTDPGAAKAALTGVAARKPLLYGATSANLDDMAALAKEHGLVLAIRAEGLDEVVELTAKAKAAGVNDLVMNGSPKNAREIIEQNTQVRRSAVKKGDKTVGYPVITNCVREESMVEAAVAAVAVAKYSSIVLISHAEKWKNLALFTLRQNLYTDPQVPMQVPQKVYEIADPAGDSPLMITTNFSLTYFIVAGEVENAKVPARLAVMDCEGLSVLTAWAAGKFTANKIAQYINEGEGFDKVTNKELIIPGQVAILSGALEDKLPGWKITVGPREANGIPAFLKGRAA